MVDQLLENYEETKESLATLRGMCYDMMQDINKKIAKRKRELNDCKGG